MKAIVKVYKDSEEMKLVELEIPKPGPDSLLVKMKAIGVGIHDAYFIGDTVSYPYTIGIEGAGEVEALGDGVTQYRVGDCIAFVSLNPTQGGTYAEYAVISTDSLIIPMPKEMSFELAACLPIAGGTALRALEAIDMNPGESLFIAGASGAIGSLLIQLAIHADLLVSGSASLQNHEYMKRLGAIHTVDYHTHSWMQEVRDWSYEGVDGAIAITRNTSNACLKVLKENGKILSVSGDKIESDGSALVVPYPYGSSVKDSLLTLFKQVDEGDIFVFVEDIYSLDEAIDALHAKQTGHARGKTIILLD